MNLPIQVPVRPMLAQLEEQIPRGAGWRYEPKWDGFRAVVFRDQDSLQLQSRNGQPLQRYFPELVESLAERPGLRCTASADSSRCVASQAARRADPFELRRLRLAGAGRRGLAGAA